MHLRGVGIFRNKYKRCSVVYVVYPDKEFIESQEEIIEKYESDTENQYVTIPVLEAVDIVQDIVDEL